MLLILSFVVPTRNGRWYNVTRPPVAFASALSGARQLSYKNVSGFLATVTSASENAFINDMLADTTAWIGGQELRIDGNWTWASGPEQGTPFGYSAWVPGLSFSNSKLECAYMNGSSWGAQVCSNLLPYIVEYCVMANNSCIRKSTRVSFLPH
jgi:hypothetical protein